jgi:hypothetical protein
MQPIFVGDVQGCSEELDELLARAEARFGSEFELWSVGDLVNRGPDNRTPLRRVRDLEERGRARVVLGNHEISLLRCWLGLRKLSEFDSFQDVLDAPTSTSGWSGCARASSPARGSSVASRSRWCTPSADPSWSLAISCARRARSRIGCARRSPS